MQIDNATQSAIVSKPSLKKGQWASVAVGSSKQSVSKSYSKRKETPDWQLELKKTADKYHFTAAWVAVIFNSLFGIVDYLNSPEHWGDFMILRGCVSLLIACSVLIFLKKKMVSETLIFISILSISLQNAYMWSVMDVVMLQKHTLAYVALFIGVGMLVVWEVRHSVAIVVLNIIGNILAFKFNSPLEASEIMASGGLLTLSVAVFSIILIQTRYNLSKKEIISRLALKEANSDLKEQKRLVVEKSSHITESIEYAKTIQESMMPSAKRMQEELPNCRIFYRPRDIVSGDFYWFEQVDNKTVIAAVDCTGHGVPGALMSMIGTTLLNRRVKDNGVTSPADILGFLREGVKRLMGQDEENQRSDSMDIALCTIDSESQTVSYAGAYNPLYLVRNNELMETKADKMPIGNSAHAYMSEFTEHVIPYETGDMLYLFSDGFADQFGGPRDKKYSSGRMKRFLSTISSLEIGRQYDFIANEFDQWKGGGAQIDDVVMICIRL